MRPCLVVGLTCLLAVAACAGGSSSSSSSSSSSGSSSSASSSSSGTCACPATDYLVEVNGDGEDQVFRAPGLTRSTNSSSSNSGGSSTSSSTGGSSTSSGGGGTQLVCGRPTVPWSITLNGQVARIAEVDACAGSDQNTSCAMLVAFDQCGFFAVGTATYLDRQGRSWTGRMAVDFTTAADLWHFGLLQVLEGDYTATLTHGGDTLHLNGHFRVCNLQRCTSG